MKKGFYVIFEGSHGSGKTTQSKKLFEYLKEKYPNKEIIWTREPGGSEVADAIRKIVQGTKFGESMDPVCEAYLYAASRAQTLRTVVKPVLDRGGIVISDRSFITSLSLQSFGRKLGTDLVLKINKIAVGGVIPNLVLFLRLSIAVGLSRTSDHDGDKFENEKIPFLRKAELGYKKASKLNMFKGKWLNVNAEGCIDEVFGRVLKAIEKHF